MATKILKKQEESTFISYKLAESVFGIAVLNLFGRRFYFVRLGLSLRPTWVGRNKNGYNQRKSR